MFVQGPLSQTARAMMVLLLSAVAGWMARQIIPLPPFAAKI